MKPTEYLELFNSALNQEPYTAHFTAEMGTEAVWLNSGGHGVRARRTVADWNLPILAIMLEDKDPGELVYIAPKLTVSTDTGKYDIRPRRYKHLPARDYPREDSERLLDPDDTDLTDVGWVRTEKGQILTSLDADIVVAERQYHFRRNRNLKGVDAIAAHLCTLQDLRGALLLADEMERARARFEAARTAAKKSQFIKSMLPKPPLQPELAF